MAVRPRLSIAPVPQASVTADTKVGGSSAASVKVGLNPLAGNIGVTPRLRIGDSKNAGTGSSLGGTGGGIVGASMGGPAGAAVGQAVGSGLGSGIASASDKAFGGGRDSEESEKRTKFYSAIRDAGLIGDDYEATNPDGSTFRLDDDSTHSWRAPGKRVDGIGERDLFNYEIDYTNDMDYVAGMAGITLARTIGGGTGKNIDQTGNAMGNGFLGKVGYGNELTPENFNVVMGNARSHYAKAGIKSKEDALSLANQMYAEGRINDFDYGVAQQSAALVFDNNFGLAQQLMGGRWNGIKTASKTPDAPARSQNNPRRVNSPKISAAEAMASVRPYFDEYRKRNPLPKTKTSASGGAASLATGLGLITTIAGGAAAADKASGGAISGAITDFAEYIGLVDTPDPANVEVVDGIGAIDGAISEGEYDLGSDYTLDF